MDFLRTIGTFAVGGVVYWFSSAYGPAVGLAIIAAFIAMMELRLNTIARAMDLNFAMLQHLQRKPNGEPFDS